MEKDESPEHWADESGDELLDDSFLTNPLPNLPPSLSEKVPARKNTREVRNMVQSNHQSSWSQKARSSKLSPSSIGNSYNQKKNYTKRNAGSNRSQNIRESNQPPLPPSLKTNSDKDAKLISNTMAHSLRRLRGEIVTVHLLSGDSFEGVLDNVDVMHGMNVTLLQSQKQVEKGMRNTNEFKELHNIEGSKIVYLRAVESSNQVYNQSKKSGGFIDSEVGGQRTRKERELQRWEPGVPDEDQMCEPLCELGKGPRVEKWDQFKANQDLGVSTSMDAFEQTYTTTIDRGSNFYKRNERRAEELAKQIEQNTVKHKHILMERDRGNKLASNMSEECLFSQVLPNLKAGGRGKQKSTKNPPWLTDVAAADVPMMDPATIALPTSGKYVNPHMRKIYEKMGIFVGKTDTRAGSKNVANQPEGQKEGVKRDRTLTEQQQRTGTPSTREPTPQRRRMSPVNATPSPRQKDTDLSARKQNSGYHGTRGTQAMRNPSPMSVVTTPVNFQPNGIVAFPRQSQPPGVPSSENGYSKPPNPGPGQPPTGKSKRRDAKPPTIQRKSSLNPMAVEFTPTYSTTPKQKTQDLPSSQPQAPGPLVQGWRSYIQPNPNIQMHPVPVPQPPQGQPKPHQGYQPQNHTPRMVILNGQPNYIQVPIQRQPNAQMLMHQPVIRMPQGAPMHQGTHIQRMPMYIHQPQAAGKPDANKGQPQHATPSQPANSLQPTSPFQNQLQQHQFFPQMFHPQVAVPGMFPTQYVLKQGMQQWPVAKLKNQIPQQMNQQNFNLIPGRGQAAPNQQGIPQWNGNMAQFAGMPQMQNMQNGATGMPQMQNIQNAQSQTPR